MSGIAAIVACSRPEDVRVDGLAVRRMLAAGPHRGAVTETWSTAGAALGVQAITPPSEAFFAAAGHAREDVVAVVHGSLYRLDRPVWAAEAARLVADAYLARGVRGLAALRGSFVAVVVRPRTGSAVGYRSPVGEVPLFWRVHDGLVAFGSEVKQVLAAPLPPSGIDQDALLDVVAQRWDDPGRTVFGGFRRVRAGGWVEMRDGEVREGRAWDPRALLATSSVSFEEAVDEFRYLLRLAVARRLTKGAALLLSGGLDSTAVAAEAAPLHLERYGEPLSVVSAAYPDFPGIDEARYIRQTAGALGCRVLWVEPHPRPFDSVREEAALHDGPTDTILAANFRLLLRAGRERGVGTFLDGHSGDNVLGTHVGLLPVLLRRRAFREAAQHVRFLLRRKGTRAALRFILASLAGRRIRSGWRAVRGAGARSVPAWVGGPLAERLLSRLEATDWFDREAWMHDAVHEVGFEALERIALTEEAALVHPFADVDLVEFLLSLPPEIKFASGQAKALVRAAYPEVPQSVLQRADKTRFDALLTGDEARSGMRAALARSPGALQGVDRPALMRRIQEAGIGFAEAALVFRVLQAEHVLASAPEAVAAKA